MRLRFCNGLSIFVQDKHFPNTDLLESPSGIGESPRLQWIQALRAFAAFGVLVFHVVPLSSTGQAGGFVLKLSQVGIFGVDLFFVLSGFVLARSSIAVQNQAGIRQFLAQRIIRIFSGYYLALIPLALLLLAGMPPLSAQVQTLPSLLLTEWRMENNLLPVAWSLTFELWFYGCFTVLLALGSRVRVRLRWVLWLFLGLILWHAAWAVLRWDDWVNERVPLVFFATGLGLEFLMGSMLGYASPASRRHLALYAAGVGFLFLGGFGLILLDFSLIRVSAIRALTAGLAAFGLLLLALGLEKSRTEGRLRLRPNRFLVAIGDASYSLYLLHSIIIGGYLWLRIKYSAGDQVPLSNLESVGIVLGCCTTSVFWFSAVERPVTNFTRRLFGDRR